MAPKTKADSIFEKPGDGGFGAFCLLIHKARLGFWYSSDMIPAHCIQGLCSIFNKKYPPGLIAFTDEIIQAFTLVFAEIANDGEPKLVGREFLKDIPGEPGLEVKEIRCKVMFMQDEVHCSLISAVHHQVYSFLGRVYEDGIGDYFCDSGVFYFQKINSHSQIIKSSFRANSYLLCNLCSGFIE